MIGWIMNAEEFVELEVSEGTRVLRERMSQSHVIHHESHKTWDGNELIPPPWKARNSKQYGMEGKITKQAPWPLVCKRTIPNERPPLVGEIQCQLLRIEGCHVVNMVDLPRR
jgi:hypothetical protein